MRVTSEPNLVTLFFFFSREKQGYGPDLDRIFDSEKKAIDYIENELKDYDCHRDDYGIYEAEINDYESISLSIEEMEVG